MVLNDVIVEQIAIVSSHLQGRMSYEPLKRESIAAAIHQILTSECMPERMDRSSFHASGIVVLYDSKPQGVLCEEIPKLITKEDSQNCFLPEVSCNPEGLQPWKNIEE